MARLDARLKALEVEIAPAWCRHQGPRVVWPDRPADPELPPCRCGRERLVFVVRYVDWRDGWD